MVVTDNERILGLGVKGRAAGSVGKLALYRWAGSCKNITHLSLDVGLTGRALADHSTLDIVTPVFAASYDDFIEAFAEGARSFHTVLQWEDFKQHNALRILDRYRHNHQL
jgi:malic enzyme